MGDLVQLYPKKYNYWHPCCVLCGKSINEFCGEHIYWFYILVKEEKFLLLKPKMSVKK